MSHLHIYVYMGIAYFVLNVLSRFLYLGEVFGSVTTNSRRFFVNWCHRQFHFQLFFPRLKPQSDWAGIFCCVIVVVFLSILFSPPQTSQVLRCHLLPHILEQREGGKGPVTTLTSRSIFDMRFARDGLLVRWRWRITCC